MADPWVWLQAAVLAAIIVVVMRALSWFDRRKR
jgi:hypothetical protein